MAKRTCSIEGCGRARYGRGYCKMHYQRARKWGDPSFTPQGDGERFWTHVAAGKWNPRLTSHCWLWTGSKRDGYGKFRADGKTVGAHRFAYELLLYPWGLPADLQLDHRCHNPACVNVLHLRPATNKLNGENRRGAYRNSASGVRGICWHKRVNRWYARVKHHGKQIHVGYFDTIAEAEAAIIAKRNELFSYNDLDRYKPDTGPAA